jgi:peroxiredoxin
LEDNAWIGKAIFGAVVATVACATLCVCSSIIYIYSVSWLDGAETAVIDVTEQPGDVEEEPDEGRPFGGKKPKKGEPAIDFTLEDLDGNEVTLSDYEGRPIVLNFWATWCPPCVAEMPTLDAAYNGGEYDDLVILAVSVEESPATVERFMDREGLSLPVLLDSKGKVSGAYRVRGIPTTFFIDRDGVIVDIFSGSLSEKNLEKRIEKIR